MKPDTEWIVITVLYAITMLVAFAGNSFLVYIVWKKPEVRSLTSFLFVNMAIADLLVTLVVMPWSISFIYTDSLWMIPGVFGKVMCKGVVYTAYVTLTASILCLTFMAIDRYCAIVHPLRRHLWFRRQLFHPLGRYFLSIYHHCMEFMVPCCTWSKYFGRKSSATRNL